MINLFLILMCVFFPSAASTSVSENNQVVLNTGGDQYQTVTIVPSDGHTGEVSSESSSLKVV
jgi:hypothetical protein